MKKRLSAMFLALALCFGLAVPAFAAGKAARDPLPSVSFDLPDGYEAPEKTDTYRLRKFHAEDADGYRYTYTYDEEPAGEEITCTAIPLGTGITINGVSGISALPGEPAADGKIYYNYRISVGAYSDPDGDGVYDERIIYNDSAGTVDGWDLYSIVPASEKGPFTPPKNDDWSRYITSVGANHAGFQHYSSYNDTSVAAATSDILYELFGPNTLIRVTAELAGVADSKTEEVAWFRLTGEAAPPALTVNITDLDDNLSKQDMELTLRNITEEYHPGNKTTEHYTDFTRDEETETVKLKDVPVLTERGFVNIRGIKAVSDDQKPWSWVRLSAWSDPDGDGVYDQHLFSFYQNVTYDYNTDTSSLTDSVNLVPISQPGPFSFFEYMVRERGAGYSRFVNLTEEGTLISYAYTDPNAHTSAPSSITLNGNYLTWLFGPDTLLKIQPSTGRHYLGDMINKIQEGPAFYCYIPKDAAAVPAFTDVPEWCEDAVDWAVENGITNGTSYTRFSPGTTCTNAMILTFLWRAAEEPGAETPCPVTLPASLSYAEKALAWAAEKGMVDETLDPRANCTRASAVSYIWQAFGKESAPDSSFNDVPAGAAYAAAVNWAVANGITNGTGDGAFSPDATCKRGEIAAFLHRAYVPEVRLNAE